MVRVLLMARAQSILGTEQPTVPIDAAAFAVAGNLGGPAMVDLASLYPDVNPDLLDDALDAALREVGWETADMFLLESAVFVARARAAHVVAGRSGGRALGRWAHAAFAWDDRLSSDLEPLWMLDIEYEEFDAGAWGEPDAQAVALAFLHDTEDPSWRWRRATRAP